MIDVASPVFSPERAFPILIPWRTSEVDIDGTFDSLVRLVAQCVERRGKEWRPK